MERLLVARCRRQLSCLQPTSQAQVLNYLSLLQARHDARGTLDAVVTILKRFSRYGPESRQAALASNLAQTTAQDIEGFICAASSQGLSPATINPTLSVLKPTFKGVWYAAVNFAPLPLLDTRLDQCPQPRR
jgi:site-specific recombinase XerD